MRNLVKTVLVVSLIVGCGFLVNQNKLRLVILTVSSKEILESLKRSSFVQTYFRITGVKDVVLLSFSTLTAGLLCCQSKTGNSEDEQKLLPETISLIAKNYDKNLYITCETTCKGIPLEDNKLPELEESILKQTGVSCTIIPCYQEIDLHKIEKVLQKKERTEWTILDSVVLSDLMLPEPELIAEDDEFELVDNVKKPWGHLIVINTSLDDTSKTTLDKLMLILKSHTIKEPRYEDLVKKLIAQIRERNPEVPEPPTPLENMLLFYNAYDYSTWLGLPKTWITILKKKLSSSDSLAAQISDVEETRESVVTFQQMETILKEEGLKYLENIAIALKLVFKKRHQIGVLSSSEFYDRAIKLLATTPKIKEEDSSPNLEYAKLIEEEIRYVNRKQSNFKFRSYRYTTDVSSKKLVHFTNLNVTKEKLAQILREALNEEELPIVRIYAIINLLYTSYGGKAGKTKVCLGKEGDPLQEITWVLLPARGSRNKEKYFLIFMKSQDTKDYEDLNVMQVLQQIKEQFKEPSKINYTVAMPEIIFNLLQDTRDIMKKIAEEIQFDTNNSYDKKMKEILSHYQKLLKITPNFHWTSNIKGSLDQGGAIIQVREVMGVLRGVQRGGCMRPDHEYICFDRPYWIVSFTGNPTETEITQIMLVKNIPRKCARYHSRIV